MAKPRPQTGLQKNKKKKDPADGHSGNGQTSEYRDLRRRVNARKDAKQILKIAKMLENEP